MIRPDTYLDMLSASLQFFRGTNSSLQGRLDVGGLEVMVGQIQSRVVGRVNKPVDNNHISFPSNDEAGCSNDDLGIHKRTVENGECGSC